MMTLLVLRHVENHFGDVGRRPFPENFTEASEITRLDQAAISGIRILPTISREGADAARVLAFATGAQSGNRSCE